MRVNSKGPVRVAVIGSCVSRDPFNRRFNPNYKDLFDCVALSNQVAIVSLLDSPVPYREGSINNLDPSGQREVERELKKTFLEELVAADPEYLILDFFPDAHFGCLEWNGSLITQNRWKLMKTSFFLGIKDDAKLFTMSTDPERYFAVWSERIDQLFAFLGQRLPKTKVVLHSARHVERYLDSQGELHSLRSSLSPAEMNAHWDRFDSYVKKKYVDRVIDIHSPELTSYEGHPWGSFFVHYTMDYYANFLSKLTQIVVQDLRDTPVARRDTIASRLRRRIRKAASSDLG